MYPDLSAPPPQTFDRDPLLQQHHKESATSLGLKSPLNLNTSYLTSGSSVFHLTAEVPPRPATAHARAAHVQSSPCVQSTPPPTEHPTLVSPARPSSAVRPSSSTLPPRSTQQHSNLIAPNGCTGSGSENKKRAQSAQPSSSKKDGGTGGAISSHSRSSVPSRDSLPQWTVNARPLEDMLQFRRTDKEGFQMHEGGAALNSLRLGSQEEELPVGVLATAIYMAQTSGSLEGLKAMRISRLPTQVN